MLTSVLKYPVNETAAYFLQGSGVGFGEIKDFNVFKTGDFCQAPMSYNRRDFYKISLVKGTAKLHYADRGIIIDRPAILFANPLIPYAFEPTSEINGFFCLFSEDFFGSIYRSESLQNSPLFKIGSDPVFFLDEKDEHLITSFFETMLAEMDTDYLHKFDLMRNYVSLILHEAMKMQPNKAYFKHQNATDRVADTFLTLLERQFPIDSPQAPLKLRTPKDFATQLSVHTNHLNSAVKKVTGKTTSEIIIARVVNEAKALLTNTNWNVAEIAYSLGFGYATYFNNVFKKHTGLTPSAFRN